jgi:LacI family transcriptional regulator
MVTLKDVAKRANVSLTTASYSINNNPLITEETKQKVLKAAKELNYRPNGMAKNLKEQKTNIIGLFISGFSGPFFNDMISGVQDVAIANGYELVVCASDDKHRLLVERYVDGAIVLNFHMNNDLLESLASEKLPIVVMDRKLEHQFIKNVVLPNERGAAMAVDYLVQKGHRRIGFLAGSSEAYDGEMRLKGFKQSLEEHGLELNGEDILRADFTEKSGYLKMKTFLNETQNYPSALVCANDEMAIGAIRAIKEKGLDVPEDLAVVGFDDINVAKYFNPSLTTIRVERKQWGEIAANTIMKMIAQDFDFEVDETPIEMVVRYSG